jgi:uncharacterized membrane protein
MTDPVHLHLALVHVPVVGLPLALLGWTLARRRGERFWERLFEGLWAALAAAAGAAYFSGGAAYERLRLAAGGAGWTAEELAESHALAGRAAALVLALSLAALLQVWILRRQGLEGRGPQRAALALGLAACLLLVAAAWLGGPVGHAELR